MSNHIVARVGLGALHIAEPNSIDYEAICGKRLAGPKVHTWSAGKSATAVWREWRRCATCEELDRKWRHK